MPDSIIRPLRRLQARNMDQADALGFGGTPVSIIARDLPGQAGAASRYRYSPRELKLHA
jgi:hypothetical protein